MSPTIIIYLFLLFSTLSLLFFNYANGHLDCNSIPSSDLPPECQCKFYDQYQCPMTCDINDCREPFPFNCDDFPPLRLPNTCICGNFDVFNCPIQCFGRCNGHGHGGGHVIPDPGLHHNHPHDDTPIVEISYGGNPYYYSNGNKIKIEWLILLTIFGWNVLF